MNPDGPSRCGICGKRLGRRIVSHYCKVSGAATKAPKSKGASNGDA